MKPSEKRALDAEKRAQRETEAREQEIAEGKSRKNDGDKPRREGFAQSHVRIITFVICMLILIPVCLFGVDTLVAKKRGETVSDKRDITMSAVYTVAEAENGITWEYFEKFNYTDLSISHQGVTTVVREYAVADTELTVRVVGINEASGYPDKVLLIDYWSGESTDLRNGTQAVDELLDRLKEIND